MAEDTFQSIEDEIKAVEKTAESAKEALEKKKQLFINDQLFSGKDLMQMRQIMRNGGSAISEPNLPYILERILQERADD